MRRSHRLVIVIAFIAVVGTVASWRHLAAKATDTPAVGGLPLFAHWPQDAKPEAVIVLSGQTFGYLSPCGCSRPQKGGLERRYNFLQDLRGRGWPTVALDGGDVAAPRKVPEQDTLKYVTSMKALKAMGTAAIGLGDYDFELRLDQLLGHYAVQNPDKPPIILAANLVTHDGDGKPLPRMTSFPGSGKRPVIDEVEVIAKDPITQSPIVPIGVTSVIGRSVFENKIQKTDPTYKSLDNAEAIKNALKALAVHPAKPAVKVLLYTGTLDEAKKVAAAFPEFNVILCQIEESEPPQFPTVVNDGKTYIVQVGHKGQNVGAVGVYRIGGELKLFYQLVPLGEEYITPKDKVATHPIIQLMESYSLEVKNRDLLSQYVAKPGLHAAMISHPEKNLAFVGSEKCKSCHPQEHDVWSKTPHGHAMDALEKLAVQPGNRQFDGDCVVCHTIGFGLKTGYTNESATAHLKHVGCETCHGPGSGHAANPKDEELLKILSPWKTDFKKDRLPGKDVLEQLANAKPGQPQPVQLNANQQRVMAQVGTLCLRCHDGENDPKFDLNIYMPKIWHSGLKAPANNGLPGFAK